MSILIISTATIGLPRRGANPRIAAEFRGARLIEFAFIELQAAYCVRRCGFTPTNNLQNETILTPATAHEVSRLQWVIKPSGFTISNSQFHGITTELAEQTGMTLEQFAKNLEILLARCSEIIAHNTKFHIDVVLAELYQINPELAGKLNKMPYHCTALSNNYMTLGKLCEVRGIRVDTGRLANSLYKCELIAATCGLIPEPAISADSEHSGPLAVSDVPFLYEHRKDVELPRNVGKWTLFYSKDKMDAKWNLAKELYNSGGLPGVRSMKVSTSYAQDKTTGVIIFYCNDSDQKELILEIGRNIVAAMNYCGVSYIYYRKQSANYLYKLEI
jgi:hypothetical protein